MSSRSDVIEGRLVYTEKLGWVDTGHSKGNDAKMLMTAINSGDDTKESYFIIKYTQYPDPKKYPNNARPYYSFLPTFLNTISPITDIDMSHLLIHIEDRTGYNIHAVRDVGIELE
ncbi:hypothetical protein [Xenorhabdus bovienii]|uniref:hypothetical protein n=1 Tax=Xenorhabdus bovienii TaxID=40576 RepID=UPI0023B30D8B|nr:hypothetical protein [Xenorhabdus bovienii]MDE9483347.1 hypothetical protein [Xenorhabdus bovienii]